MNTMDRVILDRYVIKSMYRLCSNFTSSIKYLVNKYHANHRAIHYHRNITEKNWKKLLTNLDNRYIELDNIPPLFISPNGLLLNSFPLFQINRERNNCSANFRVYKLEYFARKFGEKLFETTTTGNNTSRAWPRNVITIPKPVRPSQNPEDIPFPSGVQTQVQSAAKTLRAVYCVSSMRDHATTSMEAARQVICTLMRTGKAGPGMLWQVGVTQV